MPDSTASIASRKPYGCYENICAQDGTSQETLSVTSSLPALSTGEPSQGSEEDQSATSQAGQIGIGETESAAGQPTHSTRDTDEAPFDPWADPDQKPLLNLLRLVTGQLSLAGAFHGAAR